MEVICLFDGPVKGPYVYIIQYKEYVYIGETQGHPVKRFSDHLSNKTNFSPRLKYFEDEWELGSVRFYSIYVGGIVSSLVKRYSSKSITQAVEHTFHCYFSEKPSLCGGRFYILSDTEKTAPRKFYAWGEIEDYVSRIIPELKKYIV
ncbi:GIY-YIG nuclease family protein [Vibrio maerlii]|uniref:GIY-YIG nuclease family protein n=1 Tax=Vibrio maerlii TaxID=2231648 RepID=UPI000E3EA729|nr:GIY-YIG nuclease family protein [Vibrio maerlii]